MANVPFDSPAIWNCIRDAGMQPPGDVQVDVWSKMIRAGQVIQPGETTVFVLFAPNLKDQKLQGMIPLLKKHAVPSGFRVADSFFNQKVLVVGDFTDEELLPLANSPTGVEITRIKTKTELRQKLAQLVG